MLLKISSKPKYQVFQLALEREDTILLENPFLNFLQQIFRFCRVKHCFLKFFKSLSFNLSNSFSLILYFLLNSSNVFGSFDNFLSCKISLSLSVRILIERCSKFFFLIHLLFLCYKKFLI